MSIKAGAILHSTTLGGSEFVIDRIQTGGVGNVNVPEEKVYELGNWETVATIRDIPDLSFDLESLDVSTEIEQLLCGVTGSPADGAEFDFNTSMPLDIISPFKSARGAFDIVKGIAVPYLTLESATYRFGLRQNATQSFTLRGDAIYYCPGTPKISDQAVSGLTYSFGATAIPYSESGHTLYALGVCLRNNSTKAYKRLFFGTDYTNTSTGITLTAAPSGAYNRVCMVFATTTAGTYSQAVHQDTSVKPAAVRPKDIDVYVYNNNLATPALARWTSVQSVDVTRRVTLDNDEEFGNSHYVASDYDVADVTGSISLKPTDPAELWSRIAQIANVSTTEIAGALTSTPLEMEIRISDPDSGSVLKTLYVPDARFTAPSVQGRVQQKLVTPFNWVSDSGTLKVYKGARP